MEKDFLGFLAVEAVALAFPRVIPKEISEKLKYKEGETLEIQFIVNGVEVPVKDALVNYIEQWKDCIRKDILKNSKEESAARDKMKRIQEILNEDEDND